MLKQWGKKVDVEAVGEKFQMELIELQSREEIKSKCPNVSLLEFYKFYLPENNFPQLYRHATCVNALFGSTYVCEELFSKIKHSKSKLRSRLTGKHLQSELTVASSNIKVDICDLMKDKQCQTAH
jgi:hypothetical protein